MVSNVKFSLALTTAPLIFAALSMSTYSHVCPKCNIHIVLLAVSLLDLMHFLLNEKWHFIIKMPAVNISYRAVSVIAAVATFITVVVFHYGEDNDSGD